MQARTKNINIAGHDLVAVELRVGQVRDLLNSMATEIDFLDILCNPDVPVAFLRAGIPMEEATWEDLTMDEPSIVEARLEIMVDAFRAVNPTTAAMLLRTAALGRNMRETRPPSSMPPPAA